MKMTDIRKKNDADLKKELGAKRTELREVRFDGAGSNLRNASEGRKIRRAVAQIKTEMRAREIAEANK